VYLGVMYLSAMYLDVMYLGVMYLGMMYLGRPLLRGSSTLHTSSVTFTCVTNSDMTHGITCVALKGMEGGGQLSGIQQDHGLVQAPRH
jgi:hypothetical protein